MHAGRDAGDAAVRLQKFLQEVGECDPLIPNGPFRPDDDSFPALLVERLQYGECRCDRSECREELRLIVHEVCLRKQ